MAYLTKVVVNSITIKDDTGTDPEMLYNWSYQRRSGNNISELSMETPIGVSDLVTLQVGQTVEIWAGYTTSTDKKVFSGFISEFNPEAGKVSFICKDKMWDLIRKNVNNVYEDTGTQAGQVSEIAKDLIETYGGLTADVTATGTGTGETISEFRCDNTDIWERLYALASAVNYSIWYDPVNDTVHFEQGGTNDSGITLTVGTEIIDVPKWTNDTSRMVNDLRVDGAVSETAIRKPLSGYGQIGVTADFTTTKITLDKTPESVELWIDSSNPPTTIREGGTKDASTTHYYYIDKQNLDIIPKKSTTFTTNDYAYVNYTWAAPAPIHQTNPTSIALYGTWEKQVTLSDIQSIADAEARTSDILAKFSDPFLLGEFLVDGTTDPNFNVGDKVLVVDTVNVPNISQELVITTQTLNYPSPNQEIQVGDESLRLADWQLDVETRIKRLEELLTQQNQDLILELYDFSNQMKLQPRYRLIETGTQTGDTLIWDHPTFGIWDSYDWGDGTPITTTPHWVGQYLDIYEETFYDTDFQDTLSDVTWDTINKELVFI